MKIGIDARMFSDAFTGIGRYNFELTKRFFALRPDVQWVLFLNEPEANQFIFPTNVTPVVVNAKHYSAAEQTKFIRLLAQHNCDHVHFSHFNVPLLYRRPYTVTIHDTTISFFPGNKMGNPLYRLAYQAVIRNSISTAKQVVAVSHNTKADVQRLFGTEPNKITVVHNGISQPPEIINDEVKVQYNLADSYVLYTGNWREHKNIAGLVRAFAIVRKQLPHVQLVLTGKPDPHYPDAQQAIEELGLEKAVRNVGYVPEADLHGLYRHASAYCFPSLYEGFGMPPLEAMAHGTPVAVSNTSSLPEVCGEAAEYFDPLQPEQIAASLMTLLTEETRRTDLIEKGYAQVQQFGWDTAAQQTLDIIMRVAQSSH